MLLKIRVLRLGGFWGVEEVKTNKEIFKAYNHEEYWIKQLRNNKENIIYLRGFFLDRAINIENKIINIISMYCTEEAEKSDLLVRVLMSKEISFNEIITIFKEMALLNEIKQTKIGREESKKIEYLRENIIVILEIRNKFAHWDYDSADNMIFNSYRKELIEEEKILEWYNKFEIVSKTLDETTCSFLEWDKAFVKDNHWRNSQKRKIHFERLKKVKDLFEKNLSKKKYDSIIKPIFSSLLKSQ